MAKYNIQKATEINDQSAPFKKALKAGDLESKWQAQRKYDGCNLVIRVGTDGVGEALSRTGEEVRSVDHIVSAVSRVYGPGWVVLGEAWIEGTPQPTISGLFRQHAPAPALNFVVFDIIKSGSFALGIHDVPYRIRQRHLNDTLRTHNFPGSPLLECAYYNPGSYGCAQKLANALVDMGGYDGCILRDLDSHWAVGPCKSGEIIKVKPVKSFDLQCTGVEEGKGKLVGMAGALLFTYKGQPVKATGGTFPEREQWFREPPVGRIFEVECIGITEDGKLREPRLKGERFDKLQPDN